MSGQYYQTVEDAINLTPSVKKCLQIEQTTFTKSCKKNGGMVKCTEIAIIWNDLNTLVTIYYEDTFSIDKSKIFHFTRQFFILSINILLNTNNK